ncbi:unnamed protein product [Protopolystoma xenopodis]|uniref:Uncharacterized protein n=1 Tax=Protopolystoma xenopodis TaxID=117903 RepID=A0A448WIU6_9PLAT|nr:unnamed protein product [Protopolystoma xenopodis]
MLENVVPAAKCANEAFPFSCPCCHVFAFRRARSLRLNDPVGRPVEEMSPGWVTHAGSTTCPFCFRLFRDATRSLGPTNEASVSQHPGPQQCNFWCRKRFDSRNSASAKQMQVKCRDGSTDVDDQNEPVCFV